MPDVLIRNIDEETLEKLKTKAAANNRSLQNELHEMINAYTFNNLDEMRSIISESVEKYKAEGRSFSDSVEELRDDRER
jgi:plasmid stability protein